MPRPREGNAVRQNAPAAAARNPAGHTSNGKKAAWAKGLHGLVRRVRRTAATQGTAAATHSTSVAPPTAAAAAAPGPGAWTRGTLGRGTLRSSSAPAAPVQPPRSVHSVATARPSSRPGSSNRGRSTPSEPAPAITSAGTHPPGRRSSSRAERTTGGIGCPYTPASPPVTEPKTDGRTHPRAPIELKVDYKKLNSFFADYTRNISKGGTFIKTRKPLPVGTRFLFVYADDTQRFAFEDVVERLMSDSLGRELTLRLLNKAGGG